MSNMAITWNGGIEDVTSSSNPDFLIDVTEYEKYSGTRIIHRRRTFKVSGEVMTDTFCSVDFHVNCKNGLKGYTVDGIRLWLRIIHKSMLVEQYEISMEEIWNALAFGIRYGLPLDKMKPWYNTWLLNSFPDRDAITREDLKMHLSSIYPRPLAAFRLRHKEIIVPDQRLHEGDQSQPTRSTQPKAACESISTKPSSTSRVPDSSVLSKCSQRKECLWEYMDEVILTKLWPFSAQHREAIQSVLDSTGMTKWTYRPVAGACMSCVDRLGGAHVKRARYDVANYWTGMCLDCVNLSMDQAGTKYAAYFSKDKPGGHEGGCRLRHARNDWYHVFMGPQEAMA